EVKERCVFCAIVRQEVQEGRRIVQENADIVAIAPYAPRFAFETWLVPKAHGARFEQTPRHVSESLARLLKAVVQRLDRALEAPPGDLVLHPAPAAGGAGGDDWHGGIMARVAGVAGFEWGTGFYINPTAPEEAAKVLRSVRL